MIKSDMTIKLDLSGLANIQKALKEKYEVRVGVFADKAVREAAVDNYKTAKGKGVTTKQAVASAAQTITNPELAIIHELGSKKRNIPARSFLRMPLTEKAKELKKFLSKKEWAEDLAKGSMKDILVLLGFRAEQIVDEAFGSRGFGKWAANKPSTVKQKGSEEPLLDSQELRRSIMSKVVRR